MALRLKHRAVGTIETWHRLPPAAVKFGALFSVVRVENAAKLQIRDSCHSVANVS